MEHFDSDNRRIELDHNWYVTLDATFDAVSNFAEIEFASLNRKAIYRLQRFNATGIFGDDYKYKTLWDEYCHEIQEGPHIHLEDAWDQDLEPFLNDVIDRIPHHIAIMLSIFAAFTLDEHDLHKMIGSVYPDGIKTILLNRLSEEAGMRSIEHLRPWG